jgi:hypothetical protein
MSARAFSSMTARSTHSALTCVVLTRVAVGTATRIWAQVLASQAAYVQLKSLAASNATSTALAILLAVATTVHYATASSGMRARPVTSISKVNLSYSYVIDGGLTFCHARYSSPHCVGDARRYNAASSSRLPCPNLSQETAKQQSRCRYVRLIWQHYISSWINIFYRCWIHAISRPSRCSSSWHSWQGCYVARNE